MARKYIDRYVRYYTFGSAAPKMEPRLPKVELPNAPKPRKKAQPRPILVDPFALAGCAMAVILAVLMIVGIFQVNAGRREINRLETQLTGLEQEEQMLRERYENGYDLDEVRAAAQSMGMIPMEDAQRVTIQMPAQTVEFEELSWWDAVLWNLRQFFA